MTYFKFDRKELDSLPPDEKKRALFACDLAEKIVDYYQTWAINFAATGKKGNARLDVTLEEQFFLSNTIPMLDAMPEKLSGARAAVVKLMLATQMDFYRENPQYVGVFPHLKLKNGKAIILAKMQETHDKIGPSFDPIDKYYEEAFTRLKTWAATYVPPPSKPPKP